jgi:hypothetical protein
MANYLEVITAKEMQSRWIKFSKHHLDRKRHGRFSPIAGRRLEIIQFKTRHSFK